MPHSADKRILLAWEAGSGRGHLLALKAVAEALGDGFVFEAALCRLEHAHEMQPPCSAIFPCAYLSLRPARRRAAGNPRTATWGEFLGDLGFADAEFLTTQLAWWITMIEARKPDMVIGDFAPCALLAAKILGVPSVSVGTGYSTPPASMPLYPVLLSEIDSRIYDETDMTAAVNTAIAHFGGDPIAHFPEVYDVSAQLSRTVAGLDPYAAHRRAPYMPPLGATLPELAGDGDELLIYFSTDERDDVALMEAIGNLPMPRRLYMPAIAPDLAARLSARGIIIETAPMPTAVIAARTRLVLHAGNHGMICMAFAMGLPQVGIPRHLEHLYHARRAADLGPLTVISRHERDPQAIAATITSAYENVAGRRTAKGRAQLLRSILAGDVCAIVGSRLRPLLSA